MLHFLKDWWKFSQIHQYCTMALRLVTIVFLKLHFSSHLSFAPPPSSHNLIITHFQWRITCEVHHIINKTEVLQLLQHWISYVMYDGSCTCYHSTSVYLSSVKQILGLHLMPKPFRKNLSFLTFPCKQNALEDGVLLKMEYFSLLEAIKDKTPWMQAFFLFSDHYLLPLSLFRLSFRSNLWSK